MGFYKFTWPYPADSVLVTGEFDKWQSSVKLEKDGETGKFSAVVDLGDSDKTFYKYIVNGSWTTNDTEKIERDNSGIENNVLYKADMYTKTEEPAAPLESVLIQSAAPVSTTATLAAAVPYETAPAPTVASDDNQTILTSSVAPTSTTAALAAQVPYESREASKPEYERPTPGFSDVPGGFPETPAVDEATTFQVNPLPAYTTPGNPITLAPGEPVPTFNAAAVHDTLTLDKESYEKADASNLGAGFDFSSIPAAVSTSQKEDSLIPESSLPILPAAAENVPAVVKESQAIANASPAASASEAVVEKKDAVEQELINNPPTLHHTEAVAANSVPAIVKESQAIAHASPEASASETAVQKKDDIEHELITSPPHLHHHKESNIPQVVAESQAIANASPEASANEAVVQKKDAVEHELLANPPHLEHVQDKSLAEQIKDEPAVLAGSLIDDAQPTVRAVEPTVRAVEPEAASENVPPSTTGNRPSSPAALATPPVATTTTSTYTTPVPGTTTFTAAQKASSTTSADSTPKSDDDTKEKISGEFDKGSDKRKEKRRSYLFTRIRNLFR